MVSLTWNSVSGLTQGIQHLKRDSVSPLQHFSLKFRQPSRCSAYRADLAEERLALALPSNDFPKPPNPPYPLGTLFSHSHDPSKKTGFHNSIPLNVSQATKATTPLQASSQVGYKHISKENQHLILEAQVPLQKHEL